MDMLPNEEEAKEVVFALNAETACLMDSQDLKLMMRVLNRYEKVSGQLINLNKSAFYVHEKVQSGLVSRLKQITGIRQGLFPFTYLGCPIFYSRNRISHYDTVVKKISKRMNAWQGRLLSYGGRATLISHVLQSMLVYLLPGMNPPKGVIRQMYSIFSRFFWSNTGDKKGVHWVKLEALSLPKDKGGLGFRSLFEVSNALFCRLWWNLRTKPSLWSSFMIKKKYCKKLHPVIAHAKGASSIWRKLIIVRELVEHQIWWQVKKGDSSFWFDNWKNLGALYHVKDSLEEEIEVQNFASTEGWNAQVRHMMRDYPSMGGRVRDQPTGSAADELSGLPPEQKIDFAIDVLLDTKPISIPLYRMARAKLKELKAQLKDLLEKGCIRSSSSTWGAPVLFFSGIEG
ncbi:uncharacterized protein LOC132043021 [Lycium ferocissimum]|uniref:uncharacterized protein LOC132043021 n=1 Tax=Lycium ferocissimum TaxID=112874 RepID=UPI00281551F6|nr:uncharacterized protein LOC132043021 [Lycium ferocissimum]